MTKITCTVDSEAPERHFHSNGKESWPKVARGKGPIQYINDSLPGIDPLAWGWETRKT